MTKDAFNKVVFTQIECTLTLYPARPDGAPITDTPLWTGAPAEGLTVRQVMLKVETRPTGSATPKQHPLIEQFQISIDRIWQLPIEELGDFIPTGYERYVLDVTWQDEDGGQWHRRAFYGVTFSERTLATKDIESGSNDGQLFDAETMQIDAGTAGPIPTLSPSAPYRVLWMGADGQRTLYSYNDSTHQFTAVGVTTGRATIVYDAGVWKVTFDGSPAVVLSTATGLQCACLEQMPDLSQLPRLDFLFGNTRVATITPLGLWARAFNDATPTAGAGKFQIYKDASLVATFAAAGITAGSFLEP